MQAKEIKVINKSKFQLPEYATKGAAGLDLRANLDAPVTLNSLERTIVPTGLYVQIPEGTVLDIRPRSGLAAKHGVTVCNTPGTVDADYRGEIGVILVNLSKEPFTITPGERIAQAILSDYYQIYWNSVDKLDDTERGEGGFGSTGKK